jgi:hypothetical protein
MQLQGAFMANIQDMSTAIHSALEEIGVTGELAIHMDGDRTTASIGRSGGNRLKVAVDIQDLPSSSRAAEPGSSVDEG